MTAYRLMMDQYLATKRLYEHTYQRLLEGKGLLDEATKRNTELELALYLMGQKLAKAEAFIEALLEEK